MGADVITSCIPDISWKYFAFTHSQKLLTIGVYCKRKNKFLLRMWFLVRWPWLEDDWYLWIYDTHKLNLGSCENELSGEEEH